MKKFILLGGLASTLLLAGCAGGIVSSGSGRAEALLNPTKGNAVSGTVVFSEAGNKLRVIAEVSGLSPGPHGFHIHEKGDCSAPDGTSAGGHFNPTGKPHGNPEHADHHAGDLPQLVADAKGVAKLVGYIDGLKLNDGEGGIVGRSVIVHATADDFKTQPTGNSGARFACGVIVKK
ncbi:MAG: hypothetical protein RLZZ298_2716 [Pseudomonadota bacterium]